jgi:hypothetical protein
MESPSARDRLSIPSDGRTSARAPRVSSAIDRTGDDTNLSVRTVILQSVAVVVGSSARVRAAGITQVRHPHAGWVGYTVGYRKRHRAKLTCRVNYLRAIRDSDPKSALFPSAADCEETPYKGVRAIGGVEIARQPRSRLLETLWRRESANALVP